MNKRIQALLIVALLFLLSSCGSFSVDNSDLKGVLVRGKSYDATGINSVDISDIGLHAELRNIESGGAVLVVRNESSEHQWFPQRFAILELCSIKDDNEESYEIIRELPYSAVFWEDIRYSVWPESESMQSLRWDSFYGELDPTGIYMLEKEYHSENEEFIIGIVFHLPGLDPS